MPCLPGEPRGVSVDPLLRVPDPAEPHGPGEASRMGSGRALLPVRGGWRRVQTLRPMPGRAVDGGAGQAGAGAVLLRVGTAAAEKQMRDMLEGEGGGAQAAQGRGAVPVMPSRSRARADALPGVSGSQPRGRPSKSSPYTRNPGR